MTGQHFIIVNRPEEIQLHGHQPLEMAGIQLETLRTIENMYSYIVEQWKIINGGNIN